ncbi:hypothetical protein CVT24_005865 [Panaeolus cyanescens]|uniref:Prenylcysteine lyase domain-containing protein n=1 Tax=Panaeolus cyanescens TaxID=181874 RepID=A0A409YF19_9AGAR|nr:hypothetical protein CVT24_005865 [Panaeolus cyanescens]
MAKFRGLLNILFIAFLAAIWFAEWKLITSDLDSATEDRSTTKSDFANSFKIAVVGAGAGGSSSAFWVSKAMQQSTFNTTINIDIYERFSYVGGRSLVTNLPDINPYPYRTPTELGAHLFGEQELHLTRASKEFALPLHNTTRSLDKFYIWNGGNLITIPLSLLDKLRFSLLKGSHCSLKTSVSEWATNVVTRILSKDDSAVQDNSTNLTHRLTTPLSFSLSDYLDQAGVPKSFANSLLMASDRVSGSHWFLFIVRSPKFLKVNTTDNLQAMFASAFSRQQHRIIGGTSRIFEEFVTRSGASLFLNTEVTNIEHGLDTNLWKINTSKGAKEYDAVILAAPLYQSNISIPERFYRQIPLVLHREIHVTVIATRSSSINRQFLGFPSGAEDIRYIISPSEGRPGQPAFSIMSYEREASPGVWIVKVISHSAISAEWLLGAFNDNVNWVHRHTWGVPVIAPTTGSHFLKLDEGFYFLNAFESVMSSMEGQVDAARNLVDTLLHDTFGQGFCGTNDQTPRMLKEDYLPGH